MHFLNIKTYSTSQTYAHKDKGYFRNNLGTKIILIVAGRILLFPDEMFIVYFFKDFPILLSIDLTFSSILLGFPFLSSIDIVVTTRSSLVITFL